MSRAIPLLPSGSSGPGIGRTFFTEGIYYICRLSAQNSFTSAMSTTTHTGKLKDTEGTRD
jgi:hypothetical protein